MANGREIAEPVMGVPYVYSSLPQQQFYCDQENPYQAGLVPSDAVFCDPTGIPLRQTMYKDTPAHFSCVYCGSSGLTTVRSKPSLAALVGCMMPFMMGFCFLSPSMDCLWHKYHYCPSCGELVGDFQKSDICLVVDPPHWKEKSFALPA